MGRKYTKLESLLLLPFAILAMMVIIVALPIVYIISRALDV